MIIQAVSNHGRDLPEDCKDSRIGFDDQTEFPITIGKTYVVYALTFFLGHPWYYICDDDRLRYPVYKPGPLFKVVDGRLSRYWEYGYFPGEGQREAYAIFAFKEWAQDLYYYDRLTDTEEDAVATFEHYKQLMDTECNQ